jgi:hypothetical protein
VLGWLQGLEKGRARLLPERHQINPDHLTQARLIRRYIAWRDAHLDDAKLRHVVRRAKAAKVA